MSKRVAIVGGGISGLTTAYLLNKAGFDIRLFEASERIGGNIQTIKSGGYTIEEGPTSLLRSPKMVELIKQLGLEREVLAAEPLARKRYVFSNGKLEAMGPKTLVNGYFSLRNVAAILREPFVRSRSPERESVADFVSRRLGRGVLEKAVDPFVSGIYAGDPQNLSVRSAFPRLFEMERDFGSLIVGAFRGKKEAVDASFPRTFSFRTGLTALMKRLADNLGDKVVLSSAVTQISESGSGFSVQGDVFDAVVLSTPAAQAGHLVESRDQRLADLLRSVDYPPIAVVMLGIKSEYIDRKLDGFGFLIPSKEKRRILGTLFHSAIFPARAPSGHELLITFVGGVKSRDAVHALSDDDLTSVVLEELREILGLRGDPDLVHIKRWVNAIPQYRVGYEDITQACDDFQQKNPGLFFCSNFYRGVSMGDCVKNAFETSERLEQYLGALR